MKLFEIILLLFTGLLPFICASKKVSRWRYHLVILLVGLFLAHFTLEGLRWQMSPIYLTSIIGLFILLQGYKYYKGNWFRKFASGFFLFLMLILGYALSTILPIFNFSTPTGEYAVGSQYLHLISEEDEVITNEIGDKRELILKVWYPAKITTEKKETYLNESERAGLAKKYGLPSWALNYLDKVETNTYENAKIYDDKFPILIFSHGYYSNATGYQALLEEIVSQGFIVININHTYESVGAPFPNGEMKFYDSEFDSNNNTEEMAKMIWLAMEDFKKAENLEQKSEAIDSTLKNYFAADINERWAKDFDLVVATLSLWEKSSFLSGHVDTTKIGAFGHSQGGGAASQALLDNPKVKAGVNLDGAQWGNMIDTSHSKPFLLLASDWPSDHPDFNKIAYKNGSSSDFYSGKILDSGHASFMDIPFMLNLSLLNEAGSIEPQKAIDITGNVVVDFFNKYLNDADIDLLKLAKSYPNLELQQLH